MITNKEALMVFYEQALTVNSATKPATILTNILANTFVSKGSELLQLKYWHLLPFLN